MTSSILRQDVAVGNELANFSYSNKNPLHNSENNDGYNFFMSDNNTSSNSNNTPVPSSSTTATPFDDISSNNSTSSTLAPTSLEPRPVDADDMWLTIGLPFFLIMLFFCCTRGNAPGREYWRGEEIRARAERIRAARLIKRARHELTPEERQAQILDNMRTMKVVSKDPKTGTLKLNNSSSSSPHDETTTPDDMLPHVEKNAPKKILDSPHGVGDFPQTSTGSSLETKSSEDTADTQDVDDVDADHDNSNTGDDDVCYICLDSFEVGDVVMWSRRRRQEQANGKGMILTGCQHVFHHECLMPWLLEKRENECPSCRSCFIVDQLPEEIANPENQQPHLPGGVEVDEDGVIRVPTTTLSTTTATSKKDETDIETGKDADSDDELNEDIDEGFSFVISKGLIQRIPTHYSTLAGPVPFRRLPTEVNTSSTSNPVTQKSLFLGATMNANRGNKDDWKEEAEGRVDMEADNKPYHEEDDDANYTTVEDERPTSLLADNKILSVPDLSAIASSGLSSERFSYDDDDDDAVLTRPLQRQSHDDNTDENYEKEIAKDTDDRSI
jgi:hypothetical protein